MDRISIYLDLVPLPVLLGVLAGAVLVAIIIPPRLRLAFALAALPPWLAINKFFMLGSVAALAKPTSVAVVGLVGLTAFLHPGAKRSMPGTAWLLPLIGLAGLPFILTTDDAPIAAVIQSQLFIAGLSAVLLARNIADRQSLLYVLRAFSIGSIIALSIAGSHLLVSPGSAFRAGLGRFEPWGANSNQIGILFSFAVGILSAVLLAERRVLWKTFFAAGLFGAVVLTFLTGSRSTIILAFAMAAPTLWQIRRKPIVSIGSVVGALGVAAFALAKFEGAALQRLSSLKTGRVEIAAAYLQDEIAARPLTGLFGTSDRLAEGAMATIGAHPHNAYLAALYLGGLAYTVPLLILISMVAWACLRVIARRKRVGAPEHFVLTIAVIPLLGDLHGMVNGAILYPTHTWCFVYLTMSAVVLALASDIKRFGYSLGSAETSDSPSVSGTDPSESTAPSNWAELSTR